MDTRTTVRLSPSQMERVWGGMDLVGSPLWCLTTNPKQGREIVFRCPKTGVRLKARLAGYFMAVTPVGPVRKSDSLRWVQLIGYCAGCRKTGRDLWAGAEDYCVDCTLRSVDDFTVPVMLEGRA